MKSTPILTILLALAQFCHAQAYKDEKLTYLDENGEKTKEKDALMLEQTIKLDDTLYQFNFYLKDAPMFRSFQSNDADGSMLTGDYRCYDASGRIDTSGSYEAGKRNGDWYVYANGHFIKQLLYDRGNLVWAKDTLELKRESDSNATALEKDTTGDKTFTKVEIESEFRGGAKAWLNYLQKNMYYPDKAVKKRIQGTVVVCFVVDKKGHIPAKRVFVDHSVEYTLDQEALRIVFASPDWTPAIQDGRPVNSYKKQPLVFRFQ